MEMWRDTTFRVWCRGCNFVYIVHGCCQAFGQFVSGCGVHKFEHRIPLLQSEEHQLVLDVFGGDSGQGHLIYRQPLHSVQTVVGQCKLAARTPQAFRSKLCATVMSVCVPRVVSQLRPLLVQLRTTSAVSMFMSPWWLFMSQICDFMS